MKAETIAIAGNGSAANLDRGLATQQGAQLHTHLRRQLDLRGERGESHGSKLRQGTVMNGIAHDEMQRCHIRNTCQRLAPSIRNKSRVSVSTALRPVNVFSNKGKKAIKAAIRALGAMPKPHQMTKRGARASLGMACEAMI